MGKVIMTGGQSQITPELFDTEPGKVMIEKGPYRSQHHGTETFECAPGKFPADKIAKDQHARGKKKTGKQRKITISPTFRAPHSHTKGA